MKSTKHKIKESIIAYFNACDVIDIDMLCSYACEVANKPFDPPSYTDGHWPTAWPFDRFPATDRQNDDRFDSSVLEASV